MHFDLLPAHRMLQELVRRFVADELMPLKPAALGGHDLPAVAMVGVNEGLGRTVTPYTLSPDSPNLRILAATVPERQRAAYLEPYIRGKTVSAIGNCEPDADRTRRA